MTRLIFSSTGQVSENLVHPEVEVALLAGLLANNRAIDKVRLIVTEQMFSDAFMGRVFRSMCRVYDGGLIANVLTIKPEMDQDPEFIGKASGSGPTLARIASGVVSRNNLEDYAEGIRDLWQRRQLVWEVDRILSSSRDQEISVEELVSSAMTNLTGLVRSQPGGSELSNRDAAEQVFNAIMKPPKAHPTGLPTLDDILGGGVYESKLYGIAARKKAGKTLLLATLSHNMNISGVPHLFVSLEMTPLEIEQRNAARHIDLNPIVFLKRPSRSLAEQVAKYQAQLPQNVWYEHRPGIDRDELLQLITRARVRHGIKGVFIDYQQLVRGRRKDETQEQHQGMVAQDVADLCKRDGLFAVMAAQLNQEGNTRGGEGLRLAADAYLVLHREANEHSGWIEMQDARYVPHRNMGSGENPLLWLRNGSHFSEDPPPDSEINTEEKS